MKKLKKKKKQAAAESQEMEVMWVYDIIPITAGPYDKLELTHTLEIPDPTGHVTTTKRLFKCEPFKETTIDRVAIVGMSGSDLKALGMQQGLGVVLGERIRV